MRSGKNTASAIAGNPVLIGAATVLVVAVAVFLSYNANAGLPFVPTFKLKVETTDAARLVKGNEVREGGYRIGQVSAIETTKLSGGRSGAELTLQLDQKSSPLPVDTTVLIRPRSTLGLKYVEVVRGNDEKNLESGATIDSTQEAISPEFDEFFDMFDDATRRNSQTNLGTFGAALAGRGQGLNRTFASLPSLLRDLQPVMRNLASEDTQLGRFFSELEDGARISAPVADDLAEGFTSAGETFEAISRNPDALKQTISDSPETLDSGIRFLPDQRPFLQRLAAIADETQAVGRELQASLPPLNRALAKGVPVLRRTPRLNEDLEGSLRATLELTSSPTTNRTIEGLTDTMATLDPTLKWVGPHVTVCNYWNYFWTYLSDHLSDEDSTGTVQRIQTKSVPRQKNSPSSFGASEPANGEGTDPITQVEGDPVEFHGQAYGRAVDSRGRADCESGQRGYMERLATGTDPKYKIVVDPRTPGTQGPTYTGRARVPKGQTFSAEPTGRAPRINGGDR